MRFAPSFSLLCLLLAGCSRLTTPVDEQVTAASETGKTAQAQAPAPNPTPAPAPAPTPPRPQQAEQPKIRASHVLVAYKGAMRADPAITRSKEDAKKQAEAIARQAKLPKADFAALARKHSDDKGSGPRGGDLGEFTAAQMVKPFSDAAFALKPGDTSGVVESPFGFHVIRRTP